MWEPPCREYYALTARPGDQFFGATGGAGYTYPWSLPDPTAYFARVASLNRQYMPADVWVDVWDGGCPGGQPGAGDNPCLPMYARFEQSAKVGGFSQWCASCNHTADPHRECTETTAPVCRPRLRAVPRLRAPPPAVPTRAVAGGGWARGRLPSACRRAQWPLCTLCAYCIPHGCLLSTLAVAGRVGFVAGCSRRAVVRRRVQMPGRLRAPTGGRCD